MSKIKAESCKVISIYEFNAIGCLDRVLSIGVISWKSQYSFELFTLKYSLNLEKQKINLFYDGGYETFDLMSTPCNYGKERYWFVCTCGIRVAKLYLAPRSISFSCRHCSNITYRSRIQGWAYTVKDVDEAREQVGRWYYGEKKTRKHKAYLQKKFSFEGDMLKMAQKIGLYDL